MKRHSNTLVAFLQGNWHFILMACMLVAIYFLYKKAHQPHPVVDDNRAAIQRLHQTVDSLRQANNDLQIAYDNKQSTIINNITYKNAQDAKTISKLPKLNSYQLDSLWAVLLTSKDSVPRGYWDILKQKAGK